MIVPVFCFSSIFGYIIKPFLTLLLILATIDFIVVLFSSVFLVSLFFQAVFMISFFAVIFFTCCNFVHCDFCLLDFFLSLILLVLSTSGILSGRLFRWIKLWC